MRTIPTKYLKGHEVLAANLYSHEGRVLLKAGASLNEKMIEKINMNHIYTVYIEDIHSDQRVNPIIDANMRITGIKLIKEMFEAINRKTPDGQPNPESLFKRMPEFERYTNDVLYELGSSSERKLEYMDIKNVDNYLFSHSLNVAILSVLIGTSMGYNQEQLKQLFIGGIFCDIGLALLPREVVWKTNALTTEEKLMILKHPITGQQYLKDKNYLTAYVKVMALQHHERYDGSGYPNRIKGDEINEMAQIIGIADIYDAMTSDRPYSKAVPIHEAVEYIMGAAGTQFRFDIANKFVTRISPYPVGTHILLSTGDIMVVDEVRNNLPLRPKGRIIKEMEPGAYTYEPIDLSINNSVVVEGIKY